MSDWVATEAEFRIREKTILGSEFPKNKVFLANGEIDKILELDQDDLRRNFAQLRKAFDKLKEGLGCTGYAMSRRFYQAMIGTVVEVSRPVGRYFCIKVMKELINRSMPLREALEFLVKNPPEKLSQIENPEEYITSILPQE